MIKVLDNSKDGIYNSNMELVDSFADYSSKNLDFDKPVTIELMDDEENAKNPLGTTAHYNPDEMKITIYVTGRHIKDILRSISHELIHHVQNCRGDLSGMQDTSLGYAQRDKHMRDMETEAFNSGNIMNFRDFEDNYKQRNHKMSKLQESRLKRLNGLLMEQARGPELQKIAKTIANLMSGFVDEGDLRRTTGLIASLQSEDEFKVIDALFKKEFDRSLVDVARSVEAVLPATRRQKVRLFQAIKSLAPAAIPAGMTAQDAAMSVTATGFGTTPIGDDAQVAGAPLKGKRGKAAPRGRVRKRKCPKLPLSRGCQGKLVTTIQKMLIALGYDLGPSGADGDYGGRTEKAVEAFQKAEGLGVDGVAGKNTVTALKNMAVGTQAAFAKRAAAKAAPKGAAVPPAAAPAVAPEEIPVDVELSPRQAVQTAMKMMRVTPRRPWSNESSQLAGRTVLHYMKKGDSPTKAYEKALKIFGLEGRLTKLGPVSRGVWMRSFLDKLGIMSVDDLPKLPRLPTE